MSFRSNGKRRRVENAASALSKPFRSPLRRPTQSKQNSQPTNEDNGSSSKPDLDSGASNTIDAVATQSGPLPIDPTSSTSPSGLQTRKRKFRANPLTAPKKPIFSDPAIMDLQKQERMLQSRLATLRSELDTAQQALRLETSTKDTELELLIAKWRSVSQKAAEEVFAGAQERVARMGGMKAWRERTKSDSGRWEQDVMESWDGDADAIDADLDGVEPEFRQAEMHNRYETDKKDNNQDSRIHETENDELTMEMMLKTLNVDLKIIGYDKDHQRWV
ncbi:hypothetical protein BDV25DRAFT_139277 [Aspergillus avenaceus]|uniref:Swi5-dependent recombination DNA repair protein 1 n=1 Tax=Aspergillus avenaceus TaxID=36643 RepID=A0A5N6TXI0_ASPAV|nr:hypothetical protein BDV25DRAFT_139277 [Aspergillus avenaceus]